MATDCILLSPWPRWAAALMVGVFLIHDAAAQRAAPPREDSKALIQDAYAKTKTARTLEELSEIIGLCHRAQRPSLSQELSAYVKELLAWAHNRRGEIYADRAASLVDHGRQDEAATADAAAIREFETAVQWNPDYWKAIHNRGVSYALARRFAEAVADFSRTLELKPEYAHAWFNRAEVHFERGRFADAASDYSQAIRLKPDDAAAYLRRGHAYFELHQPRKALADYDRAVQLAPKDPEPRTNRGDAYRRLGRWREAAVDYREAIALDARFGPAYREAAWLMATCPVDRYRNATLAVEAAKKAIALDGRDDFVCLDTLAAAYANAGQFDQAQQTLSEAIAVAPEDQRAALQRRMGLYRQHQPFREPVPIATRPDGDAVR